MDLREGEGDEAFRHEVRSFLTGALGAPEFAPLRGRGGPGDEHVLVPERQAWERHLGAHRWTGTAWPAEHGGRGLDVGHQVILSEEYARARAPGRIGHIGETLVGPTLIAFGSQAQQQRFLPPILTGDELWCQGYSEPDAGSDLANVATRATLDGDHWVLHGQKVWTSLAQWSQWCFVLARTEPGSQRHHGLTYLLVPMDQPGIEVRPIRQLTGTAEFNEVFFDGARTHVDHVVGEVGDGWRVAMGTLGFERGASTLGQQMVFANELDEILAAERCSGAIADPLVRQRLADAWTRLRIMRLNALRTLAGAGAPDGAPPPGAMATKLYWSTLHRDLGELAVDAGGLGGQVVPGGGEGDDLTAPQRLFLFSRADTIYAGTSEIQRNLIGERALGLPREAKPAAS